MITLAFYKGDGGNAVAKAADSLVRAVTLSRYSHVEVIAGTADLDAPAWCVSSSFRDGGVRGKTITLRADRWDLVEVPGPCFTPVNRFLSLRGGMPYDFLGALLSPLRLPTEPRTTKGAWFCSEVAAQIMGVPDPWAYSPGRLYRATKSGKLKCAG